jgi:hypothetical protein
MAYQNKLNFTKTALKYNGNFLQNKELCYKEGISLCTMSPRHLELDSKMSPSYSVMMLHGTDIPF